MLNGKHINKYWELPITKPNEYKFNNVEEAAKEFETIFTDAVKLRLRADVQVAAYLSGGIDSSITTSFIKKITPDSLRTFSIGFTEKDFDESSYQNIAENILTRNIPVLHVALKIYQRILKMLFGIQKHLYYERHQLQ